MHPQVTPLPSADRRPRRRAPARLTRRGRALVVLLVAALMLLAFSLGRVSPSASTTASTSPAPRPALRSVVVQPGDTLWEIATAVAPSVDPRVTVERISDLNALSGPALRAGQSLVLPRGP